MQLIKNWFERRFSDPQVLILTVLVLIALGVVLALGKILAPLFAAVIIAYLLEAVVTRMQRVGVSRVFGVLSVNLVFSISLLLFMLFVIPLLSSQVSQFAQQIPAYLTKFQTLLLTLPERYPGMVTDTQITTLVESVNSEAAAIGQKLVTQTLSSLTGVLSFLVFLILVPILVFFLMKDKKKIIGWFGSFMPRDRHLTLSVWQEVDAQLGNYIRGKTLEILIVGAVTFVTFSVLKLQYAMLLATLVGFSVLIPYIGAAVVTLPVVIVGFFQFGWSADFAWVFFSYGIIQALDGNALVPLLFSEVVDLHPVAIIVAVLLFGGLWGFWGVFFAIPLATVCNAILRAMVHRDENDDGDTIESDQADAAVVTDS
jgi:putative permease